MRTYRIIRSRTGSIGNLCSLAWNYTTTPIARVWRAVYDDPIMKKKVVLILIAYKAAATLEEFYKSLPPHLFDEIILVDDFSPDGTYELALRLGIEAYRNQHNLGYGGNLKRALLIALQKGAEIIVDIHPDGEYKASAILPALKEIGKGAELVIGNRMGTEKTLRESGMYSWKILPVAFLNWLCKAVLRLSVHDLHQGFRVYTRSLLEKVNFEENANDYLFSFEILVQAAYVKAKIAEVPVEVVYTGAKRGASLKSSITYTVGTLQVLGAYLYAKMFKRGRLFTLPRAEEAGRFLVD